MFEVTARLKVRDGRLEGFKEQAAEVMRQAREQDTKTLRYDWFLCDDGTQCEVREGYVDADALLEHSGHVGEARGKLFHEFAYDHDMTTYGEPSPALVSAFEAMGDAVKFTQFSLFAGLDEASYESARPAFESTARLKVRDGELEGFKEQVAEIVRQTKESDTKPLRYDWFLSADGTVCEVREAFEGPDALLAHQHSIAEAKMKLFRGFVAGHEMTLYGEASPALVATMEGMRVPYRQFSFFQGLDADVEAPHAALV